MIPELANVAGSLKIIQDWGAITALGNAIVKKIKITTVSSVPKETRLWAG
jgi:hypothetical protein